MSTEASSATTKPAEDKGILENLKHIELPKDEDGFYTAAPPAGEAGSSKGESSTETASQLLKSSYAVQVTLADQQADPNSPLYSVQTFDQLGLDPNLLKGVYAMGFKKPSKIQERALPLLLQNPPRNMIGQSQSGTGKTAAFTLAMLSRVNFELDAVQALCIAPSRELARQIMAVVIDMGKYTPVTTSYAIKDSVAPGTIVRSHIVVGTPGTITDLLRKKSIDAKNIKIFVVDEADNMLDQQGLGEQTMRVKNLLPRSCQVVLFSATFPDNVRKFANNFAPQANEIRLKQEELSVEGIKQFYMDCKDVNHKYDVLVELYSLLTIGQSIIFCKEKQSADIIAQRMQAQGHKVVVLHGSKDPAERDQIIDNFRKGNDKVLITTNVIARGIDILQVNMVVNYDLPLTVDRRPDPETYLHRIGRTGRFGRRGISINFVHDKQSWKDNNEIEQALGRTIVRVKTDDFDEMEEQLRKALKDT
ncbi:DEAD-domain-containing protein [Clavulina sp. PMI_390]|nr:DEAD-domain-containing protein [Clavulina sp. PMI_390]